MSCFLVQILYHVCSIVVDQSVLNIFWHFFYTTFNASIGSSRISPRTLFSQHTDYILHCVSVLPKSPPCCVCVSRSPWQIPPSCLLVQTELFLLLTLYVLYLTRYEDMHCIVFYGIALFCIVFFCTYTPYVFQSLF